MEDFEEKIGDKKCHNWIKAQLALHITAGGLEDFICSKIRDCHGRILRNILTQEQIERKEFCKDCSLKNVLPCFTKGFCTFPREKPCLQHAKVNHAECPKHVCNNFMKEIKKIHLKQSPSWKNTCAQQWCDDPWEIAKCCMPALHGYEKASDYGRTDIVGVLSIIRNHTDFIDNDLQKNCDKVTKVSNAIRHSSNFLLEEVELNDQISRLVDFLESTEELRKDEKARQAVCQLKQLEKNELPFTRQKVATVVQNVDKGHENIPIYHDSFEHDEENSTDLGLLLGFTDLFEPQTKKQKLDDFKELEQEFLKDLARFYKDEYSSILVSPLLPDTEEDVIECFVSPKMTKAEWGAPQARPKTQITTYEDIFGRDADRFTNIYISAEAGLGKTTFAKRLCTIWCKTIRKEIDEIGQEEVRAVEQFNFLFLILLRNVHVCEIDEMIENQVIKNLDQSEIYTKDFLQHILHSHQCLIILDGLDEWKPDTCDNVIPHRKTWKKCTILTTTRPWKMHETDLRKRKVGNFIEMTFDDSSVKKLITIVIDRLKVKKDERLETSESYRQFISMIKQNHLEELIYTPIILIQLVCLWLDRREEQTSRSTETCSKYLLEKIGQSKCEIYINVTEFLFKRREKKGTQFKTSKIVSFKETQLPQSFTRHENCKRYSQLLLCLGDLAYRTLFKNREDSCIVFEKEVAESALRGELMLESCLHTGLLSESKSSRNISEVTKSYSFIHKTFQEFFCALHMHSIDFKDLEQDVRKVCASITDILDMANVFSFLGGFNREKAMKLSAVLADIMKTDEETMKFRSRVTTAVTWQLRFKEIKDYQNMIVECEQEGSGQGERGFEQKVSEKDKGKFLLLDLVVDDDYKKESYKLSLSKVVNSNQVQLRSVRIYDPGQPGSIQRCISDLKLNECVCLQKAEVIGYLHVTDLEDIVNVSSSTLQCLSICLDRRKQIGWSEMKMNLTPNCLDQINKMNLLESVMLECFTVSHADLKRLLTLLSERHFMKQINLAFIECREDKDTCEGFDLSLSNHIELNMLQLGNLPLSKLDVHASSITLCRIGSFMNDKILPVLLDTMKEAKALRSFMCFDSPKDQETGEVLRVMHTLESLQTLVFKKIQILDNNLDNIHVPPHLKRLKLVEVSMSKNAFDRFLEEMSRNEEPVKVELLDCEVFPKEHFKLFKKTMSKSSRNDIWFCDKDEDDAANVIFIVRKSTLEHVNEEGVRL